MIQKTLILFFIVLLIGYSKAQAIYKIELDSLTEINSLQNKFSMESIKSERIQQESFDIAHLIGTEKKSAILRVDMLHINNWYGFYYKNELVFAYHEYMVNTRMGSCGAINIYDYYFIKDANFSDIYHFEEPFECYHFHPFTNVDDILKTLK